MTEESLKGLQECGGFYLSVYWINKGKLLSCPYLKNKAAILCRPEFRSNRVPLQEITLNHLQ